MKFLNFSVFYMLLFLKYVLCILFLVFSMIFTLQPFRKIEEIKVLTPKPSRKVQYIIILIYKSFSIVACNTPFSRGLAFALVKLHIFKISILHSNQIEERRRKKLRQKLLRRKMRKRGRKMRSRIQRRKLRRRRRNSKLQRRRKMKRRAEMRKGIYVQGVKHDTILL